MVQAATFLPLLISLLSLIDIAHAAIVAREPPRLKQLRNNHPIGRNVTLAHERLASEGENAIVKKRGYDGWTKSGTPWDTFTSFSWTPWDTAGFSDHSITYVK